MRTTIYESVQLYIVYVYKAYYNTKLTIIQSIHRNKFRRHSGFFSLLRREISKTSGFVAGAGRADWGGIFVPLPGCFYKTPGTGSGGGQSGEWGTLSTPLLGCPFIQ